MMSWLIQAINCELKFPDDYFYNSIQVSENNPDQSVLDTSR